MKIKEWSKNYNLPIIEVKEYQNKITGKEDPQFIFKSRKSTSFVHMSSIRHYTLILDDGSEITVGEWFDTHEEVNSIRNAA